MRPTNPHVIAVLAILHARHGSGLITHSDIESAVRALPNGARLLRTQLAEVVRSISAWLRESAGSAFELNEAAVSLLAFPADSDLSLSPEEDEQLVELLRRKADQGAIDRDDLTAVTRRFLEEALAGADIPDELLETIVQTYVRRGTLTMSEDGGRYTISL